MVLASVAHRQGAFHELQLHTLTYLKLGTLGTYLQQQPRKVPSREGNFHGPLGTRYLRYPKAQNWKHIGHWMFLP
jgi:hypothetical protein